MRLFISQRRRIPRLIRAANANLRRLVPRYRVLDVGAVNSLCTRERLAGLQALSEQTSRRQLLGNVVECGVYRGGSAVVIADRFLRRGRDDREVWLFDVFAGMPEPGPNDSSQAWDDVGSYVSSEACVRATFTEAGVPLKNVRFVVGRFEDTLSSTPRFPIAFLHLDCDWYESVRLCLHRFYDAVVAGAPIVFDDYGYWSGCRKAVDEFMAERALTQCLIPIDSTSHYLLK